MYFFFFLLHITEMALGILFFLLRKKAHNVSDKPKFHLDSTVLGFKAKIPFDTSLLIPFDFDFTYLGWQSVLFSAASKPEWERGAGRGLMLNPLQLGRCTPALPNRRDVPTTAPHHVTHFLYSQHDRCSVFLHQWDAA